MTADHEVGTFARVASIAVESIGRRLIESGFRDDDSLLTPGQPVWTTEHLDELVRNYVDQPDMGDANFFEKLESQLADSSPAAVQLFAEILILQVLPILNVGGALKVKQVERVLELSSEPVDLPDDVRDALLGGGVFHGGLAFTAQRWAQIAYLIQLARHFKSLPRDRRCEVLADPLEFREEIGTVKTGQLAQRQSLLYMAFPHFYLPVVNRAHRKEIRDGLAADYLDAPTGDLDRDLAKIYQSLMISEGGHVDLYAPEWLERWQGAPTLPPPPNPAGGEEVSLTDATPELSSRLHVGTEWLQDCIELLRERRQLIFYGPPGTGKTYLAQQLGRHITEAANVKLVQFHPAYSYEDFFEGYRPHGESGGQIGFTLKAGPLRSLVGKAVENPDLPYVLIIDEINRGNLPKIFGELYFLLEYRDQAIDLMYSSGNAEPFSLPKNIFVIGTMNTADRSIALVDAALRRRFAFLPLHPSEDPTSGILRKWLAANGYSSELADLHEALNAQIVDPDFKIGPSYFMRERLAINPEGKAVELMWRTDILPLLEEHHFGDSNVNVRGRYGLDTLRKNIQAKSPSTPVDGDADVSSDAGTGTAD